MATPHVTGLAALMRAYDTQLTYAELKTILLETVDKVPAAAGKMVSEGRINAQAALCRLAALTGDVTCNGNVGLEDLVAALRSAAGADLIPDCPTCIPNGLDVDGDSRIGLRDALYILQRVGGLRPGP